MKIIKIFTIIILFINQAFAQDQHEKPFDNPADYQLMGDWRGEWINPKIGYEAQKPELTAQVILKNVNQYEIVFLPQLGIRATPFKRFIVSTKADGSLSASENGWQFTFTEQTCTGKAMLNGVETAFVLKKHNNVSPTLSQKAPLGAVVLFDGTNFDNWKHTDGRPVTWKITNEKAMETVSGFWNKGENKKNGLGGNIETNTSFAANKLKFHLEFRYNLEPGLSGQQRGNSGLFFSGIGEFQILNSYGSEGYWDECGSIYKIQPPMVNAAAPALQWQTYDIEIIPDNTLESSNNALVTVWLNGVKVHNQVKITGYSSQRMLKISLQDHINKIQFRNIWLSELK